MSRLRSRLGKGGAELALAEWAESVTKGLRIKCAKTGIKVNGVEP